MCKESFDTVLVRKDSRGKPLVFDDGVELGWSEQSLYSLVHAPWLELEEFGNAETRKREAEIEFCVEDFDELHGVRNRSELYEDMLEQAIAQDIDDEEDLGRYRGSGRHRRAQGAEACLQPLETRSILTCRPFLTLTILLWRLQTEQQLSTPFNVTAPSSKR